MVRVRMRGAAVVDPGYAGNTTTLSRYQVFEEVEVDSYQSGDAAVATGAPGSGGPPVDAFVVPVGAGARLVLLQSDAPMVAFFTTAAGPPQAIPFDREVVWSSDMTVMTAVVVAGVGALHYLVAG